MNEEESDIYRKLQQHLDKMPVGYPATESGIEIKILKHLFTPEQAQIALSLKFMADPIQKIYKRVKKSGISMEELEEKLDEMYFNGLINRGIVREGDTDIKHYASAPWVIGMFEYQLNKLTPEFFKDAHYYQKSSFFKDEYNRTGIPQLRVIPLEQTINFEQSVANYDDIEKLIDTIGEPMAVMECICRKGSKLIGEPCKKTKLRESCLVFRTAAKSFIEKGLAREITKEETLEILTKAKKDGLVLQPANSQRPTNICTCCGCCCGILTSQKQLHELSQLFATNYHAEVDSDLCTGCGTCEERCNVEAIIIEEGKSQVDRARCIGCGVCAPTCPEEAISLKKKDEETIPPKNTVGTYLAIMDKKAELAQMKTKE